MHLEPSPIHKTAKNLFFAFLIFDQFDARTSHRLALGDVPHGSPCSEPTALPSRSTSALEDLALEAEPEAEARWVAASGAGRPAACWGPLSMSPPVSFKGGGREQRHEAESIGAYWGHVRKWNTLWQLGWDDVSLACSWVKDSMSCVCVCLCVFLPPGYKFGQAFKTSRGGLHTWGGQTLGDIFKL